MDRLQELDAIAELAAEKGALKALKSVGLGDEDAVHDVKDLRDLLRAYRTATLGFFSFFGKVVAIGVLILIGLFFGYDKFDKFLK